MKAELFLALTYIQGIPRILVTELREGALEGIDIVGYQRNVKGKGVAVEINAFNFYLMKRKREVEMDDAIKSIYLRMFVSKTNRVAIPRLKQKLFTYQSEGIQFLHMKHGRALLADEMGLGKTIQIIGLLSSNPKLYTPTVIICPAHVKLNWLDEFAAFWNNKRVEVLFGKKAGNLPPDKTIFILNHHILKEWMPFLLKRKPQLLVIDEAHDFVSKTTKTYAIVDQLAKEIKRTIPLTGTPIVNEVEDLWGIVNLINPYILGGYTHFIHRFCPDKAFNYKKIQRFKKKRNQWGRKVQEVDEEETISEADKQLLHYILTRTCMLRRLKEKVLPNLPKKIRKVIRIKVEDKKFWKAEEQLRKRIAASLRKQGVNGVIDMHSYSRMRQIIGNAKFDLVCEWIDEWLKNNAASGRKLVVTGWHIDIMERLHKRFPKSYLITGKVSTKKKHSLAREFNTTDKYPLLFGNVKSIGTGIKLTRADTMANVELPFTGAALVQLEDRLHRLTQKAKHVFYVYFVVASSLEEDILRYISNKQQKSSTVVDNRVTETMEDVVDDVPNTKLLRKLCMG